MSQTDDGYQTSSMGSLNTQFLRTIYMACKGISTTPDDTVDLANSNSLGDDGLYEYSLRTGPKKDEARQRVLNELGQAALSHFRIYFPSHQTAWDAHENPNITGGTICFNPNWWSNATFPRTALRDCESERGVLMHNKVRILLFKEFGCNR